MSKSFKLKFYTLSTIFILILMLILSIYFYRQGLFGIYMKINGKENITIEINDTYHDLGVIVRNKFKEVNDIQIENHLDNHKIGIYPIEYSYQNKTKTRFVKVVDTKSPILKLNGKSNIIHFQNEEYMDEGIEYYDNSKEELSINIQNHVDITQLGEYKVIYEVSDSSKNLSKIERIVTIVENPMNIELHYHYDHLDNTRNGWWFKKANNHERKPSTFDSKIMEEYQSYYIGNDEKKIFLTFDEGGNNITYIKQITNILNNHDVQASFFLTRNYIYKEKEFMNELVNNGHEIGNHTRNHYDMTLLANEENCKRFVEEIMITHKTIYEVTHIIPPMIFRFPKGDFSIRSMAMVHDLGFRTYFWSHAYNDYGSDVLKEEAYNNLVTHLHNGAIYLLHPANKGNYEAMEDFILEAKKQGYSFGLVSEIK